MSGLRVVSYGGGVQSTALLALAAAGKIDYRHFLFCDVGADSENPATLVYVAEHAEPFARRHGLGFEWLAKMRRGERETVYGRATRPGSKTIGIPVRMGTTGAPGRRNCTLDFKVLVVRRWLKSHGATAANPATVALGISIDEFGRMRSDSGFPEEKLAYPLVDMRLRRQDCERIIVEAGLPVPPKSSCFFCPFHSLREWARLRREEPDLFWRAVALERTLNERRRELGKDPVWFCRLLKSLDEAITGEQAPMFDEEELGCLSGYCAA